MIRVVGFLVFALPMLSACERSAEPVVTAERSLTGTVFYRERMALAPDATVHVRLEDVSRADAPAPVIAQLSIPTEGMQVPIPFELTFSPEAIEPNHRYGLRAEIRQQGQLLFTTTTDNPVLAAGAPTQGLAILVQRAGGEPERAAASPSSGDLLGPEWRLVGLQRGAAAEETVGAEQSYTIEFGADGSIAGQAHCNRYRGTFEREGDTLSVSPLATTLMACAPPSLAGEFLGALEQAARFEQNGAELRVHLRDGGLLRFTRDSTEQPIAAAPEVGRTMVFDCEGDVSFTVRTGPGEVALWIPAALGGEYLVLGQTPSGSGARYQEGATLFWNKGDTALFEVGGRQYVDCRSNPAKAPWADAARRGVKFRALGNEPSWYLEIVPPSALVLVTNLGADRIELPYTEPAVAGARSTYRAQADGRDLTVVVDRLACADTMSGEAFDATATVTLDDATLRGCGRFL